MNQLPQLFRTFVLTIAWLVVVPCLLILLAAIVPVVPWVRIYACTIVPNRAPWFAIWSLAALMAGLVAHGRHKTGVTLGLIAVASFAAIAAGGVVAHLLYVAESNGASIDLVRSLSSRTYGEGAAPDESRIYSRPQGEALWLDIYHPQRIAPGKLSPVMFVVHGGGFVEGSRLTGAANMRAYADRGWTVISVDYRLARPDRPTWNLAITDVRCALAWTVANATALGIDTDRLTLTGGSAGGSIALLAAYATDQRSPDRRCGPHYPRIAALVVKAPLIDFAAAWDRPGELRDEQRFYLNSYFGGSPDRYPERYAAADPRHYLRRGNPPALILGGGEDPLVPPEGAADLTRKATAAGQIVQHIVFPYSGHDFNTTFNGIANQALVQIVAQFMADHSRVQDLPNVARSLPKVSVASPIDQYRADGRAHPG